MGKLIFTRRSLVYQVIVVLFVAFFVIVESINGKFWTNDLLVYFGAVNDFFSGNDPYVHPYGLDTGYFKYPPFTLYLFSHFAILPYWFVQYMHTFISLIALMVSIPLLVHLINHYLIKDGKSRKWLSFFAFISIIVHLAREFHMGNVNLILLGCFSIGLYGLLEKKSNWLVIIFWSLMIILKPIMILVVIPLFLMNKWKLVLQLGLAGVVFYLFPFLHKGFAGGIELWANWFSAISSHGEYIVSVNSLKYMANFYLNWESSWIPSFLSLALLFGAMLVTYMKSKVAVSWEWILVFLAFIPNFFVTDTEHFLLSVPLLMITVVKVVELRKWYYYIWFFLALLPFSLNSIDFLGRDLATKLDLYAGTGLGNLAIVFLATLLLLQETQSKIKMHKTL